MFKMGCSMLMKYKLLSLLLNIWHTEAAKTGALFCKISPMHAQQISHWNASCLTFHQATLG
jgi:hypothetical protein